MSQKGAVALGYNAEVVHEQEAEAEEVIDVFFDVRYHCFFLFKK